MPLAAFVDEPNLLAVLQGTASPTSTTPLSAANLNDAVGLAAAGRTANFTFSDNGATGYGLIFKSSNTHEMSVHIADATFNGTVDPVLYLGYNVASTGGTRDAGENALWYGIEGDYNDGTNRWAEVNLDYLSSAGASKRFYAFRVNRSTNVGEHRFVVDGSGGLAIDGVINRNNFVFVPGTTSTKTLIFRYTGGSGELFQMGSTATATAPDVITLQPDLGAATAAGLHVRKDSGSSVAGVAIGENTNRDAELLVTGNVTGRYILRLRAVASQTADALRIEDSSGTELLGVNISGQLKFVSGNEQTTVGAAGGASALPATPTKYFKVKDSAGTTLIIPAYAAA